MFYIYKIYIYSFFKLTLLMLLVSSLDVFDCCGLELGGEGASSDPDRGDGRIKTPVWSFSERPKSFCLPGHGGTLAHFQKHDKPIPGPESRGQKDGR